MQDETSVSRILAKYVAEASLDDTAKDARASAKHSLLDTIGVILAGGVPADAQAVIHLVRSWGGASHSSVFGQDLQVPVHHAAFANGAMAHQWDFDDTHDEAALHPSAVTVPAACAVAEWVGGVSGQRLVDAIVVANDLTSRLGTAIEGRFADYPWMRPQLIGVFGAAAAAGRVLGLDAGLMEEAFGIALPQASGTSASVMTQGSSIRSLRDGFSGQSGVLATLMAAEGIKGDPQPFEGPYGLFEVFLRGEVDHDTLLGGLGTVFLGADISFKRWPCCRPTHNSLTAFLRVLVDHGIAVEEVEAVHLRVGQWTFRRCHGSKGTYRFPESKIDAHCDLPFVMSIAISTGGVSLADFARLDRSDAQLEHALSKLTWEHDVRMDGTSRTMEPVEISVRTVSGGVFETASEFGIGHPTVPLSSNALVEKFNECGQFNGRFSLEQLEDISKLCLTIDELSDVRELFKLL